MRRQIGTVLTVAGLLAVASGAAAVNVRLLNSGGDGPGTFAMRPVAATDMATAAPGTGAAAAPAASAVAPTASAVPTTPEPGHPDGPVPGSASADDHGGRRGPGPGQASDGLPQLTSAQMTLLRVAAMVRMRPEDVLALARGEYTDAAALAAIQQAAAAVGTTVPELAAVAAVPPRHERGHGGPGGPGGRGGHRGPGSADGLLTPRTQNDD